MTKLIAWGQVLPSLALLVGVYFDGRWTPATITAAWVAGVHIVLFGLRFFYPEWQLLPMARAQAAELVRVGAGQIADRLEPPQ
jgi:hypothetical protein